MEPIGLRRGRKHDQIEHRCVACGERGVNRVARATEQPDSIEALIALAQRGGERPSRPGRGRGR